MSRTISRIAGVLISLVFVFALFPGFKIKAAEIVDQGDCSADGSNVTWTLDSEGTLTISGKGGMKAWDLNQDKSPFYENQNIKKVVIEVGVTSIGNYAFFSCDRLTSITIPDSVTSIGYYAFSYCDRLTSITIPDGVKSISNSTFESCKFLTSITIPNSVTSIGDRAFYYCARLTSITIPDSVTSIGLHAFSYCRSLTSITIPDGVKSIDSGTFEYCESLTSITIPNSVTSIGHSAFKNCTSLTSITIPNSVTSIGYGDGVFEACTSLTSLKVNKKLYEENINAFYGISSDVIDYYYNATYETSTTGGSIKGNAKTYGTDEITVKPDQNYVVDKIVFLVKDKNGQDVKNELSLTNGKYLMPDYDFNNWTGDCKVTASFKLVKYHVKFLDGDGTVLKSDDLEYGKFPSYTGKTPEKQESETSTFTFDGWTNGSEIYGLNEKLPAVTRDATYSPVYKENIKPVYTVGEVKGDGINSDIVIDVHRNVDDENCIDYFSSATIDGTDMKVNEQYTVTKGSTIITIKKDFLSTLTAGEHEVKIIFSDGSITTKVTVAAKAPAQAQDPAKTNSSASIPSTGEATSASTYIGLTLVVAACVCGTGVVLLKKRKEA